MKKLTISLAAASALALAACAEEPAETTVDDTAMPAETATDTAAVENGTIVEVAQGNPDFSTLVEAVTAADLGTTLSSGEYTVFAPTNAAFDKLPQNTRDGLMSEAGRQDLSNILTYHVVEGEMNAAALQQAIADAGEAGYTLTTVNGATLTAMVDGDVVMLRDADGNMARVTATDVEASNGVIHVIDTVLMPE